MFDFARRSAISGQGARKNADVCLQEIRNGHRLRRGHDGRCKSHIQLVWIGMD